MKYAGITALFIGCLLLGALQAFPASVAAERTVRTVRIADVINPVVASFLTRQLDRANAEGNRAFLLELDTPGGLSSSMRAIIQGILNSRIPVIVYVYPAGARAASAGALITLSADFAVMAPGTNLGAAHPVSLGMGGGGGKGSIEMKKVLNDAVAYARSIAEERGRNVQWAENVVRKSISTPAREALKLKVVDAIAHDPAQLLKVLNGRTYRRDGKAKVFSSQGAVLVQVKMGWRQEILTALSNPNVAYMLMMLGLLGIFFEIAHPGVILPGAIGAISMLLALFAFQTLPVNYVGVLLILLAIVLFILEVKVTSYGMLTVGGIISLTLGSMMLIDSSSPYLQISRVVIAGTVAVCSGFFILVLFFVVRTQKSHYVSGHEGMVGEQGQAITDIDGTGRVFVHGEYWDAYANESIAQGEPVEVVRLGKNLRLEVRRPVFQKEPREH